MFHSVTASIKSSLKRHLPEKWQDYLAFRAYDHSHNVFQWKQGIPAPHPRVEAVGAVVGDQLYLFGGFGQSVAEVNNNCDVFDFAKRKWIDSFLYSSEIAQTHVGIAIENERYVYFVGGQKGAHCSPCTADCYSFDLQTRNWARLYPLPEPRYLGVAFYWNKRLHVIGGCLTDRFSPAANHWSIGVANGQMTEEGWKIEDPVPRGGIHRGHLIMGEDVYIVGGTEGDVKPIEGDPKFRCNWMTPPEFYHGEFYKYHLPKQSWERLPDMPVKMAHTDTTVVSDGRHILVLGGTVSRSECSQDIWRYHITNRSWEKIGELPYHMKSTFVVYRDNEIFLFTGQRSAGQTRLWPREVLKSVWIAGYSQ